MSATESRSAIANLRSIIIQTVTAFVVIFLLSAILGRALSPIVGVILFVTLASLSLAVTRVGEFSTAFAISMLVVAGFVLELLGFVVPVRPFLSDLLGPEVAGINGWLLGFYGLVAIGVYYVLDIRIFSAFRRESGRPEASNPDTVARAFQRRWARLLEDWRGVFTALVFLGFLTVEMAFGIVGDVGGQVAAELAGIPVLSGFVTFIALAYTNMGGTIPLVSGLPLFGTLTAGEVLVLGLALLLIGYFIREARS